MQFERIYGDDLKELAIKIVKVIGKFNPADLVKKLGPTIISNFEPDEELDKFLTELSISLDELNLKRNP